jgi:hypothetical protein
VTCDTTQLSNHVSKGIPQPQQQPIKTQTTNQHQKPTHNKPPKKSHTQKNPQQQPNKKHTNQEASSPKQDASFIRIETTFLLLDSGLLTYSTITNNLKNDYLIFIVLQSLFL